MALGGTSGGGAGAIRAGRAFVELFAEDSRLQRTLASWKGRLMGFASFVTKIGAGMIGAGSAILAPLLAVFASTVDHLDELDEAASRLGTTPEVFDALSKSAKMAGVEAEMLESNVSRMQAVLADAAAGGKETAAAFESLGLNAKEIIDLPLDEQLAAIADGLAKIDNAAQKTAAARKIFGKGGAGLLPLLGGGGDGVREAMSGFRDPALNEAAKNAGRLGDAFDKVKFAVKSTVASLVFGFLDMVGPIEVVADGIAGVAKSSREFIRENSAIIVGIAAAAAAMVAGGVAFIAIGGTISLAATAVGGFAAALVAVKAAAVFVASPLGLIAVAAAALAAGLAYLWSKTDDGRGALARLKSGFFELAGTASSAFQGIKDAFAAGDLSLAGQIAFTALSLEFAKMLGFWQDRWNAFKGFFVDGWHDAIKLIKLAWTDLDEWFSNLFLTIVQGLNKAFGKGISDLLGSLLELINRLPDSVKEALGLDGLARDLELFKGAFGDEGFGAELEREKRKNKNDHDAERNRIEKEAAAAQEARDRARDGDKQELDDKIRRLEEELAALNSRAAKGARNKSVLDTIGGGVLGGIANGIGAARAMSLMALSGRGGFGGPLAAQFGVSGEAIDRQQLAALENIEDGVDELPRGIAFEFGNMLKVI